MPGVQDYAKALRLAALAAVDDGLSGNVGIAECPVEGNAAVTVRVERFGGTWAAAFCRHDLGGSIEVLPPSLLAAAGLEYVGMLDLRNGSGHEEFRTGFAWPV